MGVPATTERFGYISCGTWSLVGLELDAPGLTTASRDANFTNELGVDGTVRYLRNVMGLWLLQECLRAWDAAGLPCDVPTLLHEAARVPQFTALIDPDDPSFLPPGDMPARIAETCRRTGRQPPQAQAETVRCILDSLAIAYRRVLRQAQELSGREVDVVHMVGGGARNELLCQLTSDACDRPVVAGPVEGAAIGGRGPGAGHAARRAARPRGLVVGTQELVRYEPCTSRRDWDQAQRRVAG